MSFGELSPDPVEMADGFMVGGAIMAPPLCGIGLRDPSVSNKLFLKSG